MHLLAFSVTGVWSSKEFEPPQLAKDRDVIILNEKLGPNDFTDNSIITKKNFEFK